LVNGEIFHLFIQKQRANPQGCQGASNSDHGLSEVKALFKGDETTQGGPGLFFIASRYPVSLSHSPKGLTGI